METEVQKINNYRFIVDNTIVGGSLIQLKSGKWAKIETMNDLGTQKFGISNGTYLTDVYLKSDTITFTLSGSDNYTNITTTTSSTTTTTTIIPITTTTTTTIMLDCTIEGTGVIITPPTTTTTTTIGDNLLFKLINH